MTKRTALDAGLSWDMTGCIIRMEVQVQDIRLTRNEIQYYHLQLCSWDNVDKAKYLLSTQILWAMEGS